MLKRIKQTGYLAALVSVFSVVSGQVNSLAVEAYPSSLRLASYNVMNLFDGLPGPPEKAKPVAELEALSQAIYALNADVIGLQEVESKATLTAFCKRYLQDMGYSAVILEEGNDQRGINVALLSRYPVTKIISHKDLRFPVKGEGLQRFKRDLLQVELMGPNQFPLTVFVAHLKSQNGGAAATRKREAEARAIHEIVKAYQQTHPHAAILLMGDFNAVRQAPELQPLLGPESGLTDMLYQSLGDQAVSYHLAPYRSRIDFLLLNDKLLKAYIPQSARIFSAEDPQQTFWKIASDHYPVSIEIKLPAPVVSASF